MRDQAAGSGAWAGEAGCHGPGRAARASKHGGWARGTPGSLSAQRMTYVAVKRDTSTLQILLRGARGAREGPAHVEGKQQWW